VLLLTTVAFVRSVATVVVTVTDDVRRQTVAFDLTTEIVMQTLWYVHTATDTYAQIQSRRLLCTW